MCQRFVFVLVVGLLASTAFAADYPKVEIFGGFQYSGLEGYPNASGVNFAATENLTEWLGITGDLGAAYTSQFGLARSNYTYTFGPTISLRAHKAYTPFVHALIGGDHASAGLNGSAATGNGLALLVGGGIDWKIAPHFAVRVPQVDWMIVHGSAGTSTKNYRVCFGVVARF
jgi:hypothetical protein